MRKLIMAAMLILLPALATAAEERPDRPHWSLELKGGAFFPDTANWSRFYGSSYTGEFGGALSYKVLRQVEVGVEGSYSWANGKGQQPGHAQQTGNSLVPVGNVKYQHAPLNLFVLARGVFNENQWLVPYAGGGWTRMFYRTEVEGQNKKQGSVNGYHVRGGVQLLMDALETDAADNLYRDFGLHHSYFFVEGRYTHAEADTSPSGSVNIGGTSCLGGLLFEF